MRVTFLDMNTAPNKDRRRTGTLVQCVHLPIAKAQAPLGQKQDETPVPNVWAVVADNLTGVMVCLPLHEIKMELTNGL